MLEGLSFDGATISDSIFGLVMMIIGLLTLGVFALHQNQLRYTNLNHIGRLKAKLGTTVPDSEDNTSSAALVLGGSTGTAGATTTTTTTAEEKASDALPDTALGKTSPVESAKKVQPKGTTLER